MEESAQCEGFFCCQFGVWTWRMGAENGRRKSQQKMTSNGQNCAFDAKNEEKRVKGVKLEVYFWEFLCGLIC
jgi:hypothetical protein